MLKSLEAFRFFFKNVIIEKDKVKKNFTNLSIDKVHCCYFDQGEPTGHGCERPQNYSRPLETDTHL